MKLYRYEDGSGSPAELLRARIGPGHHVCANQLMGQAARHSAAIWARRAGRIDRGQSLDSRTQLRTPQVETFGAKNPRIRDTCQDNHLGCQPEGQKKKKGKGWPFKRKGKQK